MSVGCGAGGDGLSRVVGFAVKMRSHLFPNSPSHFTLHRTDRASPGFGSGEVTLPAAEAQPPSTRWVVTSVVVRSLHHRA